MDDSEIGRELSIDDKRNMILLLKDLHCRRDMRILAFLKVSKAILLH